MKIYMAGVGGMLGRDLYKQFSNDHELSCSDKDVNEPWLHLLDFTNFYHYYQDVAKFKPDILFHIGAMTDLEECEAHPDEAYMNNVIGVENAVTIANTINIPVVYISTAGIFDGEQEAYDDWDTPNPINVYGRTKYLGEKYVCEHANRYFVFRAGWMMGGYNKDKKFVKKIVDQLKGGAKKIYAVADKYGSPTYTLTLASTILLLINTRHYGIYNASGQGNVNRLDVSKAIVRELGYDVPVIGVGSDHFSKEYSAPRPRHEVLVNKRLALRGRSNDQLYDTSNDWRLALKHYLNGYR